MSAQVFGKVNADKLRKNPLALMRSALADKWFPRLRARLLLALRRQVSEFAKEVAGGDTSGVSESMVTRWTKALIETKCRIVSFYMNTNRFGRFIRFVDNIRKK